MPTSMAGRRARLLPDAFIVLAYSLAILKDPVTPGGANFAVMGNPVREDPPLAPDPASPKLDPWDAGSRWLVDFADAERRGLAVRVPIDANTAKAGFARVLVVGVRQGDNATAFAALLEAHRQTDGLGIVPAGC